MFTNSQDWYVLENFTLVQTVKLNLKSDIVYRLISLLSDDFIERMEP